MALIGSLNSGISALRNFARGLEVIGNNIANVNSTAFKSSRTKYTDTFSQFLKQPATSPTDGNGSNSPSSQIGLGVNISGVQTSFLQGSLTTTGQSTDLAISGNGFFQLRNAQNNQSYATRAGDFRTDDRGYLTSNDGFRVQGLVGGYASYVAGVDTAGKLTFAKTVHPDTSAGEDFTTGDLQIDFNPSFANGRITNTPDSSGNLVLTDANGVDHTFTSDQILQKVPKMLSFSFLKNGDLSVSLDNGDSFVGGRVLLMDFRDPTALVHEGSNLFSGFDAAGIVGTLKMDATNNTPGGYGLGSIQGNTLELSNVDLTEEFANMITTQRSFQAGSRIISVSDDILNEVVNLKR